MTVLDARRLEAGADASEVPLAMTEDEFRAFYDRTSRTLWAYLSRISGNRQTAEDLLQEAYYRLLRAGATFESDDHRRHYLYRIATNLVRDGRRGGRLAIDAAADPAGLATAEPVADAERRADVRRAFGRLKPRERALLWLAYANGSSHTEIASVLGLRTGSIKLLLFRARRRLARMLEGQRP
ncbi:MAG TPA: sigma-70 family RNA polymerase sigma factor [Vicinamibacterales bacterium]|nr:sigma-70 family RNA polymerase sigma factor [Vicinamibacterales bacterium]